MDTVDPLRFIFAFIFILALIGAMAMLLRRFSHVQFAGQPAGSRIKILETRYLDPKRRLLLVQKDDTEYLLLLADGRETVIESSPAKKSLTEKSIVEHGPHAAMIVAK